MILYAVIWKNKFGEATGYVSEDPKKVREEFKDVHEFHPEAVFIEIPIKGLIL